MPLLLEPIIDADIVTTRGIWHCISCGAKLDASHRFCWSCGAPRWAPEDAHLPAVAEGEPAASPAPAERPPPRPGTSVFQSRSVPVQRPNLGLLPWLYAAGAILLLIEATQGLASFLSPSGRAQLVAELSRAGVTTSMRPWFLTVYLIVFIGGFLVAAALHGAAFYGLRRFRRWGWISAVVVAGLWSLLIVGIPVLLRLVDRNVRQAFGVD